MTTTPLPRDVRQALALMERDPQTEHSLASLAELCNVAPRTLQRHFRQFLGQSLTEILRDVRLNLVRRALLTARDDVDVTDLAMKHGFNHLGRFSGWYRERFGESPSATRRRAARPVVPRGMALPGGAFAGIDRPTLALLPFRIAGQTDPAASGLPDGLAVALSRHADVVLTSPQKAQFRLHGTIQTREGQDASVIVTLRDAASDHLLWTDTWAGHDLGEAGLERVVEGALTKLLATIQDVEIVRSRRRDVNELSARELTMRGLSHAFVQELGHQSEAMDLAARAAELAPLDPLPHALETYCRAARTHFLSNGEMRMRELAVVRARVQDAAAFAAADPRAETLLAAAHMFLRDLDAADIHIGRALALDSGCAPAWHAGGMLRVFRGHHADAIEWLQISGELDCYGRIRGRNAFGIALANFEAGRYEDTVRWLKRGMVEHPQVTWADRFLAPALALLGRKDEARARAQVLSDKLPEWRFTRNTTLPYSHQFLDRLADGWESLGTLPGG